MRQKIFVAIFLATMAFFMVNKQELLTRPYKYLGETLKQGVSAYDFFLNTSKNPTFAAFEKFFKKQTTHNPYVYRQGGTYAPQPSPRYQAISGQPFDTYDPYRPGCLHGLCPPPQGALWVNGICYCTP